MRKVLYTIKYLNTEQMKTKSLTKVTLLSIFFMVLITAVTLNSCQKESIKPKTPTSVNTAGNIDANSSLVLQETSNILFTNSSTQKGLLPKGPDSSGCATITYDTANKPYTVTYNYGTTGCVGSDGKTRAGVVSLTYSSTDIRLVNSAITITYQNYSINAATINGSVSFVNTGPNGNGNQVITETGTIIATSSTETDTMNVNYSNEWLAGEFSSPASNWQFSITGSILAGVSTGKTGGLVITSALIKNAKTPGCNFYIQGTETISVTGQATQYVDYGNPGNCSGLKSVTKNGTTTVEKQ
jgi:hypothetical protein